MPSAHTATLLELPIGPVSAGGAARALQATMARFTNGPLHAQRRADVVRALDSLDPASAREQACALAGRLLPAQPGPADVMTTVAHHVPGSVLAQAFGLDPNHVIPLIAQFSDAVAGGTGDGDAAAEQLRTVGITATSVLFQAYDATAALIAGALIAGGTERCLDEAPPVHLTGRLTPEGQPVTVSLIGRPFGHGTHACPGQGLAVALADGVLDALDRRKFRLLDSEPQLAARFNMTLPTHLHGVIE